MTISLSDLVIPVNLAPMLMAGAAMVAIAWALGRLSRGQCPFHFSDKDKSSSKDLEQRATHGIAPTDAIQHTPAMNSPAMNTPAMDKPVRQSDPANAAFLQDLQGNILNGHGRDHAAHVFIRFAPGCSSEARAWLAAFTRKHVRSAYDQFLGAQRFKAHGLDAGIFGHVALSGKGYTALGIASADQPHGLNPRGHEDGKGYAEVFRQGMKSRQKVLHDPECSQWESAYQGDIHMLVILAADDDAHLDAALAASLKSLDGVTEFVHVERGLGLTRQLDPRDPKTTAHVEHFGFVDGRSQPLMIEEQIEQEKANGGIDKWDPSAPLNLVLSPDPLGLPGKSFGSFLVYRKLEQNVRGFHKGMRDLAQALGVPVELARAMVMGRFQDGTPVLTHEKAGTTTVGNNFNFNDDKEGLKCPFQSHIRKSNPRGSSTKGSELRHRIARRGIPYGGALIESDKLEDLPESGRGLLFFCYQADIFEQFEFIQRTWSNFSNFPKPNTGIDPVIGQQDPAATSPQAPQNWPSGWGKPLTCPAVDIAGFVRMKGGEYFFSPSLSFLKSLG